MSFFFFLFAKMNQEVPEWTTFNRVLSEEGRSSGLIEAPDSYCEGIKLSEFQSFGGIMGCFLLLMLKCLISVQTNLSVGVRRCSSFIAGRRRPKLSSSVVPALVSSAGSGFTEVHRCHPAEENGADNRVTICNMSTLKC